MSRGGYTTPWFDKEFEGDAAARGKAMMEAADALDAGPYEGFRQDQNLAMAKMFESQPVASMFMYAGRYFGQTASSYASFTLDDASTCNVLRAVCMTAANMVGRSRPRAQFMTNGGTVDQDRIAEGGTKWCDGWAASEGLYETTFEVLIDCLRFDMGVIQVYEDGGRSCVQRVLPSEVRADPLDALYGKPRTTYRRRFVSKHAMIVKARQLADKDRLPKGVKLANLVALIKEAPTIDPIGVDMVTGLMRVEESWSLPGSLPPNATDEQKDDAAGYHMIAFEGGTLFEERWTKPYTGLVFLHWQKATTGMTGISLTMQLEPMQSWLNRLINRIERSQKLMCVPRIAIKRGSKVIKGAISNLIAGAIEYTDTPPQAMVWPGVSKEVYDWVSVLVQKMYDLPGINRDLSQGQSDQQAESGIAKRESLDVQQTMLQTFNQRWEQFHVSIFDIATDMAADIAERDGSYVVDAQGGTSGTFDRLDWKELGIDRGNSKIAVAPVNQLPMSPQGRLDYVTDMMKSGLWDADRARAAFDDLNIDKGSALSNSVYKFLSSQFESMLYDGKPEQPDEVATGNPQLAMRLGQQYLALGQLPGRKAPAKNIDFLRRYMETVAGGLPQPAPPPGAVSAGAVPGGSAPLSPLPPAFAAAA